MRTAFAVIILWPAFVFSLAYLINTIFDAWGQR